MTARQSLCLVLCAALMTPVVATAQKKPATLEHSFSLLVKSVPQAKDESDSLYKARRKKTHDEVLRRILRRYNVLEVRDLKGIAKPSGTIEMTMRSSHSPSFMQAVALGKGDLSIRPIQDQEQLWYKFADPTTDEGASLPNTVRVVDDPDEGPYLASKDAAALQTFLHEVIPELSLSIVRSDDPGVWRTLWLGEQVMGAESFDKMALSTSTFTGVTFGKLTFSTEAADQWKLVRREASNTLVLALDGEPLSIVHDPTPSSLTISTVESSAYLTFSCNRTWAGRENVGECTSLATARASAQIPLTIVVGPGAKVSSTETTLR